MTFFANPPQIVGAALVGRAHVDAGRGGQDAVAVRRVGDVVVAVVCDGCSAGEASEIGAGVGARFVAADLARRIAAGARIDEPLAHAVVDALVLELARLADVLATDDDDRRATIASALLFTLQVVVAGPDRFVAFGIGDGLVRVDGVDVAVAAAVDGAPDCVAYRLLPDLTSHATLVVHAQGAAWSTLTIGTDGALELARHVDTALPSGEPFGGLPLFERDARFAKNPGLARKRVLALGARGPRDDCSFVILRRDVASHVNDDDHDFDGHDCARDGDDARRAPPCA